MENMDKEMAADSFVENNPNAPEFICPKFWVSMKKGFIGRL